MNISLNDKIRVIQKDEILFKEGQSTTSIFIVKSGEVVALKRSKERLIPILWANAQKMLGEEAVLTGGDYSYSAVALSECEIIEIPADQIKRIMASAPAWMSGLLATLGERSQGMSSAIAEHRISHQELSGTQAELAPQEENRLKKLLN